MPNSHNLANSKTVYLRRISSWSLHCSHYSASVVYTVTDADADSKARARRIQTAMMDILMRLRTSDTDSFRSNRVLLVVVISPVLNLISPSFHLCFLPLLLNSLTTIVQIFFRV